eukprot:5710744-Pyramimonas_sp.AAC.1
MQGVRTDRGPSTEGTSGLMDAESGASQRNGGGVASTSQGSPPPPMYGTWTPRSNAPSPSQLLCATPQRRFATI